MITTHRLLASTAALSTCGTKNDITRKVYPPMPVPGQLPTMENLGQSYGFIMYEHAAAPFDRDRNASSKGLDFSGNKMHDSVQILSTGRRWPRSTGPSAAARRAVPGAAAT